MYKISISEAKAKLSAILARLKPGDIVTLCNRNVPIAEIRYFGRSKPKTRKLGMFRDEIKVSEKIVEPLNEKLLKDFGV